MAEGDLQAQAQTLATVQGSITNIEAMLGKLFEAQRLEKPAVISSMGGGGSRVRPAAPTGFRQIPRKGPGFPEWLPFLFLCSQSAIPRRSGSY